jgi:predicted ribosome quality control (RQC) complex YloA/Tae2 family protein
MSSADDGFRVFEMDGWEILTGKTARDNDHLSLKVGKPQDFWFHVAGMPGSHVVARHPDRPERLPREVKRVAAGLAAFYSKAREGGRVSVHWTTCKHVSKRRGAPPGQVQLQKFEKIMAEPVDPDRFFGSDE